VTVRCTYARDECEQLALSKSSEAGGSESKRERNKKKPEMRYNWSLGRKVRGPVGRAAGSDVRGERAADSREGV
jgi:hypothetical protein